MEMGALSAALSAQTLMGGYITEVLGKSMDLMTEQAAEIAKQNLQATIDAQAAASVGGLGELLDLVG